MEQAGRVGEWQDGLGRSTVAIGRTRVCGTHLTAEDSLAHVVQLRSVVAGASKKTLTLGAIGLSPSRRQGPRGHG